MSTTTSDSTITELEDRLAILELIGRLALTIDGRDWNALGQLFTDTAYHDRTSLTGGEPTTIGVAEFVDGWRIAGLTFTIQWATGNMNIVNLSMAAGQS